MKKTLIITGGVLVAILAGFAAGYLVARKRGKSHEEAIKGLLDWAKTQPKEVKEAAHKLASKIPGLKDLVGPLAEESATDKA